MKMSLGVVFLAGGHSQLVVILVGVGIVNIVDVVDVVVIGIDCISVGIVADVIVNVVDSVVVVDDGHNLN